MKTRKQFSWRKKTSVSLTLCIGLMMSAVFTGCGERTVESQEVIELHEPKDGEEAIANTEPVAYRNLYDANVYDAVVHPYVEEYYYESKQIFDSFGALTGETVEKGDVLVYADNSAISKRIQSMEEKLRTLTENYEEFRTEAEEYIAAQQSDLEGIQEIFENMEGYEPPETIMGSNGQEIVNPDHTSWWKEYVKWEGQYNNKELSMETRKEALRQKTELYTLDYEYYTRQLQKLRSQEQEGVLRTGISGQVVAIGDYVSGDSIRAGASVAAVADMGRKYIKCAYLSKLDRQNAKEIYAVVNGKRYELTLEENDDKSHSTFVFADESGETSVGDVASVVLVKNIREHVLTVPQSSVHSSGLQQYVYVMEDGNIANRQVKTGMRDGSSIEILSGLEEGELVLASQSIQAADFETVVLEKGIFEVDFKESGSLYFPCKSSVNNKVEKGQVRFQSFGPDMNASVKIGDVIATIRVEGDKVALARKETELKRAKERLADLLALDQEENEKEIQQRQENIAALEEEIALINQDYNTTEILAESEGILYAKASYYIEDKVNTGSRLAVIADTETVYLYLDNYKKYLHYGDRVSLIYTTVKGEKWGAEGKVVTLGDAMGGGLSRQSVLVELPEVMLENMNMVTTTSSGKNSPVTINATATLQAMSDVILVPLRAVEEEGGRTFVHVVKEDGTVLRISFLAGGMNQDYYWAIDGLTEGMEIICWE